jgi:hypothetical protein
MMYLFPLILLQVKLPIGYTLTTVSRLYGTLLHATPTLHLCLFEKILRRQLGRAWISIPIISVGTLQRYRSGWTTIGRSIRSRCDCDLIKDMFKKPSRTVMRICSISSTESAGYSRRRNFKSLALDEGHNSQWVNFCECALGILKENTRFDLQTDREWSY